MTKTKISSGWTQQQSGRYKEKQQYGKQNSIRTAQKRKNMKDLSNLRDYGKGPNTKVLKTKKTQRNNA
jgi:predicted RNase H-like nuclease